MRPGGRGGGLERMRKSEKGKGCAVLSRRPLQIQINPLPPCKQGTQRWCKSQRHDCKVIHCRISVTSAADLRAGGCGSVTFFVWGQSPRCHHRYQQSEKVTMQEAPSLAGELRDEERYNTLYRCLSQTAPASSLPGERYLLLTESLLLRWQFSTSPRGSAARSKLSLLLLLQLLLNCACSSIHAWKTFRKRLVLAEPCQREDPLRAAKEKRLWHPLPPPWASSHDLWATERWTERGNKRQAKFSSFSTWTALCAEIFLGAMPQPHTTMPGTLNEPRAYTNYFFLLLSLQTGEYRSGV